MSPVFYERRSEDVFAGPICNYPFPSHVHDVAEIVCITSGELAMTIGGREVLVRPGDIAMAFPSVPHSYDRVSKDADGVALIFSPDAISEFSHRLRCMTVEDPLLSSGQKDPELDRIVENMQRVGLQQNAALKLGYLHLFLSYLFSCIHLRPVDRHVQQSGLSYQVLHYISEHYTEPLSLETTARALGISRIHLSHIFSQQLRINFRQYINTLRIDRACYLLRDPNYNISQIAYLCGYGNPRTFHRAFLAQCQMPPKQYRQKILHMEDRGDDGE